MANKLNLGCGINLMPYFVNVDKFIPEGVSTSSCKFVQHDLETFVWPFEFNSVDQVVFNHSLEHMGADPVVFCRIMQELYRVCIDGAEIHINVPHPRHDHFLGDPTHVRVVLPDTLQLFSKANCALWKEKGAANSPLAVYYDVDFDLVNVSMNPDINYMDQLKKAGVKPDAIPAVLASAEKLSSNVISEIRMVMKVVKHERTSV